jgi:hypothetical protein
MNCAELIADLHRVLDTAIDVHSPPTWRGPPLVGRDIVRKAEHLKQYIQHYVTEFLADALPAVLAEQREAQRKQVNAFVLPKGIHTETRPVLQKLHKRLTAKQGPFSKIHKWFLLPPNEIWPSLPPEYYAIVKQPMDLRTVGEKLSHQRYATHGDMYDDLQRIWDNAKAYNAGKTDRLSQEVAFAAATMALEFEVLWAEFSLSLWDRLVCSAVKEEVQAARDEARKRQDEELERQKAAFQLELQSQKSAEILVATFDSLRAGGFILHETLPADERILMQALSYSTEPAQRVREFEAEAKRLSEDAPRREGIADALALELRARARAAAAALLSRVAGSGVAWSSQAAGGGTAPAGADAAGDGSVSVTVGLGAGTAAPAGASSSSAMLLDGDESASAGSSAQPRAAASAARGAASVASAPHHRDRPSSPPGTSDRFSGVGIGFKRSRPAHWGIDGTEVGESAHSRGVEASDAAATALGFATPEGEASDTGSSTDASGAVASREPLSRFEEVPLPAGAAAPTPLGPVGSSDNLSSTIARSAFKRPALTLATKAHLPRVGVQPLPQQAAPHSKLVTAVFGEECA